MNAVQSVTQRYTSVPRREQGQAYETRLDVDSTTLRDDFAEAA
ncbi:hypothetical protein [Streptomyces sp. CJ_13]|nr:hypothetical protein [Streptomyces sp. CJ_13]